MNTTTESFPSTGTGQRLPVALNSVRQLTDASGDITLAKSYAPYGEATMSAGNGISPFAYTGEQVDVSGLTYLRARYYSSNAGRFISKDTWAGNASQPLSLNQWNYVNGNPINYTDPSGYSPSCAIKGTCGPDVTDWFMNEMRNHYEYGLEIRNKVARMKALALTKLSNPCKNPLIFLSEVALEPPFVQIVQQFRVPFFNNPLESAIFITPNMAEDMIDALGILEFALYGLAVDYSNIPYTSPNASCNTGSCGSVVNPEDGNSHQVISLCNQCRDASDLGNMMFGLGGSARGYSWSTTLASALFYNGLADDPKDAQEFIRVTVGSADGYGAFPGWLIGSGGLYYNRYAFCAVANIPVIGRDNLDQIKGCQACSSPYMGAARIPSSINRVSGLGGPHGEPNTIVELQNQIDNLFEKIFLR